MSVVTTDTDGNRVFMIPSGAEVFVDSDNYIETEVVAGLDMFIDHDLEGVLDLLSYMATDTELLMDISYHIDRVDSFGNLIVVVGGDISEIMAMEDDDE